MACLTASGAPSTLRDPSPPLVHSSSRASAITWFTNLMIEASWAALVDWVVADLGSVDVLANVAGIISTADVENESVDFFDRVLAVNVRGVWLGMKIAAPAMTRILFHWRRAAR